MMGLAQASRKGGLGKAPRTEAYRIYNVVTHHLGADDRFASLPGPPADQLVLTGRYRVCENRVSVQQSAV